MRLKHLYTKIILSTISLLPETRFFNLKRYLLVSAGANIGKGVKLCSSVRLFKINNLTIGSNSWIGQDVMIIGGDATVTIGSNCDIGPRVTFAYGSHHLDLAGPRMAGTGLSKPIIIGDGTWIGAGAVILGGVTLANNTVVAAGAVVTKSLNRPYSLVAGVPATICKEYK